MANQITPMQSLQEKMQEHIRQKFAEIVPDEIWVGLTDKIINEYVEKEIPRLVKEYAAAQVKERLNATLKSQEWTEKWGSYGVMASNGVSDALAKHAPEMFAALVGSMVQNVVNQIRYNSGR